MEPPKHQSLSFVSWNTMGIRYTKGTNSKLQLVLDELIRLKADVVFLQETHIEPRSYEVPESIKGWRTFFTVHHPRSKGVAILIKNEKTFNYICHDEDYSGGYIVLFCHLYGQLYTLVNVYNHKADRQMLYRLRDYLTAINTKGVLVVGGDFQLVLDELIRLKADVVFLQETHIEPRSYEVLESIKGWRTFFTVHHPRSKGVAILIKNEKTWLVGTSTQYWTQLLIGDQQQIKRSIPHLDAF
uniref:exodeoxyribonuclease III n=1 Tax=Sinocyclocheilus grahami TaxID=75366 RepID=A0A672QRI8_SINGR